MLLMIFLFQDTNAKHFVLIHGSGHGAWCWYKLVALLRSSGHDVTALDMAASGINLQQVLDVPTISNYFRPLMDFMDSVPTRETVILVAHSSGGLAVSLAMERFPDKISVSVFVTALMPGTSLNISTLSQEFLRSQQGSLMDSRYSYDNGADKPPTTLMLGPKYLSVNMYQLSPIQDWSLATMLVRPVYLYTEEDMSRELVLSSKKYGSISRVYIMTDEDKVARKELQQWMVRQNPPDKVVEIKGSDHMVMMSRPTELFDVLLLLIAQNYS
ncbi:UNVERIFIED_CONTAM: putative esterase PIR7A [Sesamum radiatum]|uniref:Esterase PIR7A n=1 Tax=Sesamum radiatum TaxID=300843 RepID=A0AAW2RWG8_SESRA